MEKERNRLRKYRVVIFLITYFSYASLHAGRQSWSFVKSDMKVGNDPLSTSFLGYMDFTFLISYAIGLATLGHLGDRIDLRFFVFAGMIVTASMYALIGVLEVTQALTGTWKQVAFILIWIINGLGQSTGMPGFVATMGNWFGSGKRGALMGIWIGMTNFGDILGYVIGSLVTDQYGMQWGYVPLTTAVFIAFMSVIVIFFMSPYPDKLGVKLENEWGSLFDADLNDAEVRAREEQLEKHLNSSYFQLQSQNDHAPEASVLSPNQSQIRYSIANTIPEEKKQKFEVTFLSAWFIPSVAIYAFLFASMKSTVYGLLFWLPNYLSTKPNASSFNDTLVTSCFDVGIFAGGIAVGLLSDWAKKRAIIMGPFIIVSVTSICAALFIDSENLGINIIVFASIGFFLGGPYNVCQSAIMIDLAKQKALRTSSSALSTVTALIDGTGAFFAAFTQLAIPYAGVDNVFWVMLALSVLSMILLSPLTIKDFQSLMRRKVRKRMLLAQYGNSDFQFPQPNNDLKNRSDPLV